MPSVLIFSTVAEEATTVNPRPAAAQEPEVFDRDVIRFEDLQPIPGGGSDDARLIRRPDEREAALPADGGILCIHTGGQDDGRAVLARLMASVKLPSGWAAFLPAVSPVFPLVAT